MKKILSENKLSLFLSSVIILLPQVVAALLGEHIYYLPLQCLVLHWICLLVTFYDWRKKPQEKKITQLVLWIMPVISMTGSAFILLVKSGQVSYTLAPYFMNVGFGLMFIVLGSFLPKIRRNRTMGIKVKWALENDDNWNATHRFGERYGWAVDSCVCCARCFRSVGWALHFLSWLCLERRWRRRSIPGFFTGGGFAAGK